MPDPTDPRAVADGPSAESQDALTYVDVDVSWGNGETYPVRVASLSADQARRMFGWDPTDPRAVADDPSGIVQQMPERLIAWPCTWQYQRVTLAGGRPLDETLYIRADIARATEADLRAEVERLTRNRDMWRGQCVRQAAKLTEMRAALTAIVACWDGPKYNHFMGPNINRARAALSPETDGGQDA